MKKVLASEGGAESTGIKRALHIARGHFSDYREGRGLFGKHHGIYWWDPQLRGSVSEGYAPKDYIIDAPGRVKA